MKMMKRAAFTLAAVMSAAVLLAGCGAANSARTAITINGNQIPLGFVNFVYKYQQAGYDQYYTGLFGEDMWSQDLYGEGRPFAEDVRLDTIDEIELLYLLNEHAADYGVSLTSDDEAKISAAAKELISDNSAQGIKALGASEEYAAEYLKIRTVAKKVQDAIKAETVTTATMEDAAQTTFSYISVYNYSHYENGESIEYTEDERAQMKANLEAVLASDDWDGAASEYGYSVLSGSFGQQQSTFDSSLIEALGTLGEGETTGVIESDSYYYIGRLDSLYDEEATQTRLTAMENEEREAHYTEVTEGWKNLAQVTTDEKALEQIKVTNLFDAPAAQ